MPDERASAKRRLHVDSRLSTLTFARRNGTTRVAVLTGVVSAAQGTAPFSLQVSLTESGEWKLEQLDWQDPPPVTFHSLDVYQALVNQAARVLYPVFMWPGEQSDRGGKIWMNQKIPPPDVRPNVCFAWRPDAQDVPPPPWSQLWPNIEARLQDDPCFWVQGFATSAVADAIHQVKPLFTTEWVRARYHALAPRPDPATMHMPFPRPDDAWFPAFHLGRTATGVICVDPAWNYLVEIGLARAELRGMPGLAELDRQLCRSPGCRHQLCLAAELHKRGLLREVEPNGASGHNDLTVAVANRAYEVEVKEFTSQTPSHRLEQELAAKVERVPRYPRRPVVVHAVLADREDAAPDRENAFVAAAEVIAANMDSRLSALVVGRCFLDAAGGPVKRDAVGIRCNPRATRPSDPMDLAQIFTRNYGSITFPTFGFGAFMDTQPDPYHA